MVDWAKLEDPVTNDGCYWSLSCQPTRSGSSSAAAPGSLASSLKNQLGHRKARVVISTPTGLVNFRVDTDVSAIESCSGRAVSVHMCCTKCMTTSSNGQGGRRGSQHSDTKITFLNHLSTR